MPDLGTMVKCTTCPQKYMMYPDTHKYEFVKGHSLPMVAGMCPRCGKVNSAVMHADEVHFYPPSGSYLDDKHEVLPVKHVPYYEPEVENENL